MCRLKEEPPTCSERKTRDRVLPVAAPPPTARKDAQEAEKGPLMSVKSGGCHSAEKAASLYPRRAIAFGESPRILAEGAAWAIRATTGRRVGIENINSSGKNINYRMHVRRGNMVCMKEALLSAVFIVFLTPALPA